MKYQRKQIEWAPNYEVDTLGKVYSLVGSERELKIVYNPKLRYGLVSLMSNGKRYNGRVHRLIAETFIPNPENKPEVNHNDGDKTNNSVDNLQWTTRKENMEHAHQTGLIDNRGESSAMHKLTEKDVIEIYKMYKQGYKQSEISRCFNMSHTQIYSIVKGKQWKHLYEQYMI